MVRKLLQKGVVPMMVIAVMAVILAIGGGTYYFVSQKIKKAAQINNFEECAKTGYPVLQTYPAECKTPDGRVFSEAEQNNSSSSRIDFSNFNPKFRFSAIVPSEWLVEYIPQIAAVNIYNPNASAGTALDKSEIFIRYFESDGFLTLATVDFYEKTAATIMGHNAVRYEIQKKSGVPDYAHQPGWRSKRHKLTDIRFSKSSPSLFYVFAYNPKLPELEYDKFINSIEFHNDKNSLRAPIDDALKRVAKKPYGLKISPQSSPVSPERFNGIHTGVDFEIFPGEEEKNISVYAICGGRVLRVEQTRGYGGLMLQECLINDEPVVVAYGHIKLESIRIKVGDYLYPGADFAVLGRGNSKETDYERKHLHLGIHKGKAIVSSGYVATEAELKNWLDPVLLLK